MIKKFLAGAIAFAVLAIAFPSGNAVAASFNQVENPYFEQAGAAWDENGYEFSVDSLSYNWHQFGNGYVRTTEASKPDVGWYGIKMSSNSTSSMYGAYQRVNLNQTTVQPVYFGAYVKGQNIALAPNSYFGASLYAEIHLKNGQVVYWNSPANSGSFDWKWIGFNTADMGGLISAPIDYVFVVPSLIRASGTAYFDHVVVKNATTNEANESMMANVADPAPVYQPVPVKKPGCIIPFRWLCPR